MAVLPPPSTMTRRPILLMWPKLTEASQSMPIWMLAAASRRPGRSTSPSWEVASAAHAAHVALADGLSARHLLGWLALLDGARDALVARGAQVGHGLGHVQAHLFAAEHGGQLRGHDEADLVAEGLPIVDRDGWVLRHAVGHQVHVRRMVRLGVVLADHPQR